MVILNLLPPREKSEVRLLYILQFTKSCLSLLLFITIVGAVVISTAFFTLETDFYPVIGGATLMQRDSKDFSQEVRKLNMELRAIKEIQGGAVEWSKVLIQFTETIPDDIQITSLVLDRTSLKVNIKGKAKTREDVLAFQDNLENFPLFSDVIGPVSNILYPKNVNFQFDAKLNL
jgi:Tfp pilus assembly protein PilN